MSTRSFLDQTGFTVEVAFPPQKIISLVPSQTELLAELGLDGKIAGVTKFCVHPPELLQSKTVIGGTKNFDFKLIDEIEPDLIIGNKEENYREGIETLRKRFPVWISDIYTLENALAMIDGVGTITGTQGSAKLIVENIKLAFRNLRPAHLAKSVLYLIWRKPWMAVGKNTFIDDMLAKIGLVNVVSQERYPELTTETIYELRPDYIFLSFEPFPFQDKHSKELNDISPKSKIILVDGEMFSWYGSRLINAPAYFNQLSVK